METEVWEARALVAAFLGAVGKELKCACSFWTQTPASGFRWQEKGTPEAAGPQGP